MLCTHNPADLQKIIAEVPSSPPFPPRAERAAWEELAATLPRGTVTGIMTQAQRDTRATMPALPATLFLDAARTGERAGYENAWMKRRIMLSSMVLAECLEAKGRYLDPIMDVIWASCEQSDWIMPTHRRTLVDLDDLMVDLGTAMVSLELAEADALLGESLDAMVRKRIRKEIDRRAFTPYLERHDHFWLFNSARSASNWTAVCNGGILGAAIYLEPDLARLAEMIARGLRSLDDYLAAFDSKGGSSEGPGYWSYGFSYYTLLAHLVEHRTDGRVSLFDEEIARKVGTYPLMAQLSAGTYVNFSDADSNIRMMTPHLAYLAKRLDNGDLMKQARLERAPLPENGLVWALRSLFWRPSSTPAGKPALSRHDWFAEMSWMLARFNPSNADALVVAAKGGHNGEIHNQNDVGNFIVHVNGESVIPDIGRGRYTVQYFGPQRYESFVCSSRGHSVPVVNGYEQQPGKESASSVLEYRTDDAIDLLSIEMKEAYPKAADLGSLQRSVALHREKPRGWVEVTDHVRFAAGPGSFESVITTFAAVEIGDSVVKLTGTKGTLAVHFDSNVVKACVVIEKAVERALGIWDSADAGNHRTTVFPRKESRAKFRPVDVTLVKFSLLAPAAEATVRLRIEPL